MPSREQLLHVARRRADHALDRLGSEFRAARMEGGLTQAEIGAAARMSGSKISRVEAGLSPRLSLRDASLIASVLGLELAVRVYPAGERIRDAAHSRLLAELLRQVRSPLASRTEVALPRIQGRLEQRSWDAILTDRHGRTAVELEMRLYDVQAQSRRWNLKRRDDPAEGFLLAVADTPANRRVLRLHVELFADLPRLRTANVLQMLKAGRHPPTGVILL